MNQIMFFVGGLALAVGLVACGGSNSDNPEVVEIPATAEDVKNNYVVMAHQAYSDSLLTATSLQEAVDIFIETPTEDNLALAKAAYKAARVPYQQSEIMRWDTAITLGNNLDDDGGLSSVDDWEGQVNAWPLDENHIVGLVEGDLAITKTLLVAQNGAQANEANVTTGVHAVEFMLWGEDSNRTGAGSGERPASAYANDGTCADDYCQRRAEYLKAAIDLLVDDLTEMLAEWTPEASNTAGTLAYNFLNSDEGLDYILGSIRAMATDELASARMSAGITLGDPEEDHDCFSDLSHISIYHNFQGVRNAFYGRYDSVSGVDVSGAGLADLVKEKDMDLFITVDTALNSIEEKMAQILDAGERTDSNVRFDQIIGQDDSGVERQTAEAAINELILLDSVLIDVRELLSLVDVVVDGGGDGD